jgi:hypothetical protein
LLLLLAAAAALRLWRIDQIPPGFHFDEAFEGLEAWRILTEPGYRPLFLTGNFGVPPLNAYANALGFAVAAWLGGEAGPTSMRVTAAVLGVAGVAAVFGLGRELQHAEPARLSPALPWLAAASLAGMRWHLHFSRMGIEPVMVPLFWALACWLLLRGWRTGAWTAFAGCGLVLALGMYAYQGAWVIPFLVAAAALHLLWHDRGQARAHVPRLGLAAGVALLGVVPLAWFFAQHPDLLLLRPAQLAIMGATNSPADSTLGGAVWATLKMFGPFGRPGDLDPRRNLPGAPALNLWQAIPFYLGLTLAAQRLARPALALPVLGLMGLLLPGVVSEYAPHFHRVLGAAGPAAVLAGIGLDALWRGAGRYNLAWAGRLAAALLLLLGAGVAARDYFGRWAALPDLFYAFDVGLWEVGQWTAAQPEAQPIYITPRGVEHATLAFAWRARATPPVSFDGRGVFPLTAAANSEIEQYVVIEHEDFRTRLLLPEVLPGATVTHAIFDPAGQPYAQVYTRPVNTIPARPPQVAAHAALGDGISLAGYDVFPQPPQAGGILYLQLHWMVSAAPATSWTVFTHVVDSGGSVVAGHDSPSGGGSLLTTRWQPGWRVLDEYQISLPADLPPGDYALRAGLYAPNAARLPVEGPGIGLGAVTIVEND